MSSNRSPQLRIRKTPEEVAQVCAAYMLEQLSNTLVSRQKLLSAPEQCEAADAVQVATIPQAGGYRVWTSMQVAGTIIQQYSLTGPWSAQVTLDNATTPAASAAFTLN